MPVGPLGEHYLGQPNSGQTQLHYPALESDYDVFAMFQDFLSSANDVDQYRQYVLFPHAQGESLLRGSCEVLRSTSDRDPDACRQRAAVASISTSNSGKARRLTPMSVIAGRFGARASLTEPYVANSASTSVV